jgi:hypothetical protein
MTREAFGPCELRIRIFKGNFTVPAVARPVSPATAPLAHATVGYSGTARKLRRTPTIYYAGKWTICHSCQVEHTPFPVLPR